MDRNTLEFFEIFIPVLATTIMGLYAIVRFFQSQLSKALARNSELYKKISDRNEEEINNLRSLTSVIPALESRVKSLEEEIERYKEQTVFFRGQAEAYKHAFEAIKADQNLLQL